LLLLLGWALYCIEPGRITFRFQNVLAQLSVTYLAAFLLMRRSFRLQVAVTFALMAFTEALYRLFPVAGFNQPFVPDHNFGSWVDLLISGELSGGHWVSFNAVPTIAHTVWGVLAGQWLMSERPASRKAARLALIGFGGVVAGFALDPVDPIIKRICTASFVMVSGGWCLLALAACYWAIDIRGRQPGRAAVPAWVTFFNVVGMNSLFIYLFFESGGTGWLLRLVRPFTMAGAPLVGDLSARIATSIGAWALLWGTCYWLYRRRIVIKI
jgi:predicted acyltransferase